MADSSQPDLWEGSHLSSLALSQYHTKELTPEERVPVAEHLQSCPQCQQQLSRLEQEDVELIDLVRGFARLGVPSPVDRLNISPLDEHVRYSLLEGFVEGTLTQKEREQVEVHCAVCRECDNELQMLFEFDKLMQQAPAPTVGPTFDVQVAKVAEKSGKPYPVPPVSDTAPTNTRPKGEIRRGPSIWLPRAMVFLQTLTTACLLVFVLRLSDQSSLQKTQVAAARLTTAQLERQLGQAQQASRANQDNAAELKKQLKELEGKSAAQDRQIEQLKNQNNGAVKPTEPPSSPTPAPRPAPDITDSGGEVIVRTDNGYRRFMAERPLSPRAVQALTEGQLPDSSTTKSLETPTSNSKGAGVLQAISPVATRVRVQRPAFRWEAVRGASAYRVQIQDESGDGDGLYSPSVQTPGWTAPSPLQRGHRYSWRVQALKDNIVVASSQVARFEVLGEPENRTLDLKLQKAKGSPLEQSLILAEAGIKQEAEEKFRPFAAVAKTKSKR